MKRCGYQLLISGIGVKACIGCHLLVGPTKVLRTNGTKWRKGLFTNAVMRVTDF